MTSRRLVGELAITSCDREPIHIPGSTQTRGVLLACAPGSWTISHVSANSADVLGAAARELLGKPLKSVLGQALITQLSALQPDVSEPSTVAARLFGVPIKGRGKFNASMHTHDGRRIVEIEPMGEKTAAAPLDLVRVILARSLEHHGMGDLGSGARVIVQGAGSVGGNTARGLLQR